MHARTTRRTLALAAGVLGAVALAAACRASSPPAPPTSAHPPQYRVLQSRLRSGWNTWDSRSVLRHVLLPDAFALNLGLKERAWIDEHYLGTALIGRRGDAAERVRPARHTLDGSYTSLEIAWRSLHARVESGRDGEDLVVLVTPLDRADTNVTLVVESMLLWNRPGSLARVGETLEASLASRRLQIFTTGHPVDDPFVPTSTPYLAVPLDGSVGISTGRARSVDEIRGLLDARLREADVRGASFGPLSSAAFAIEAALAWNTIYEPRHDRVVTTVGRLWNEEYGGYALFGWDNFFLAYALTLFDRDLAFATVVEHLAGRTPDGFIPNDNAGNGRTSLDRSQPPVGALMVREIYRRFPERWFLEATFDDLLAWNRWWPHARANGALLAYGSSKAPNPFNEPDRETMVTARYESGMDDSPMYEDVPFSAETHTMALQDVGLTSLYVVDCEALADMARVLGREAIARELEGRADDYRRALDTLWHEPTGLYLNRRTDTGDWSFRLSPTHFYPLLAGVPSPERAARMIERHLLNRDEFWGELLLPSIARSDPEFPRQRYWRGAIWPPLNFLTYAGVRRAGHAASQRALADASISLFMREWQRHGYVSENYSAVTGTGDDERLSSDRFHSWGVLFALPAFIEAGFISAPADAGSVAAHP